MSDIGSPDQPVTLPAAVAHSIATSRAVTRKPNPITGKPPKRPLAAVTPRVRKAVEGMTRLGLSRKDAAEYAGITENALYQAFRKPAVLAYWNEELKVLRESARARNFSRLEEIREQDVNLGAAVRAIQVLEGHGEQGRPGVSVSVNITPGYVMAPPDRVQVIDNEWQRSAQPLVQGAKPLHEQDDV